MARNYSNVAVATALASSLNSSDTSITVGSNTGYPATPFTIIVDPGTPSEEVCEVTNVAGTTWTITRGVDGTPATSHASGAVVEHGVSARDWREPAEHVSATTSVHGIANTAALVTLTGTQTLQNKTLTTPTIGSFINAQHSHTDSAGGGVIDAGPIICTSSTRPGSPGVADLIFETDTKLMYLWDGSVWVRQTPFTERALFTRSTGIAFDASLAGDFVTLDFNTTTYNVNLGALADTNTTVQIASTGTYCLLATVAITSGVKAAFEFAIVKGTSTVLTKSNSHGDDTMLNVPHALSTGIDAALNAGDKVKLRLTTIWAGGNFSVIPTFSLHRIA